VDGHAGVRGSANGTGWHSWSARAGIEPGPGPLPIKIAPRLFFCEVESFAELVQPLGFTPEMLDSLPAGVPWEIGSAPLTSPPFETCTRTDMGIPRSVSRASVKSLVRLFRM